LDRGDAAEIVYEIVGMGRRALALRVDVTRRAEVEAAVDTVTNEFGPPSILVNNAGVLRVTPALEVSDEEWELNLAVNATAVLICSQTVARSMIAHGIQGRIIVIVSSVGRMPSNSPLTSYVASKHAAMGLVQQMGKELARVGILMNAVFPGDVDTEMLASIHHAVARSRGVSYEEVRKAEEARMPLGRLQTPEDVANMVAFLASTEANYSAGQAFDIGGGEYFW
jgi:NAD(P)-dependent dehydrogenase (short-subunit alcohol dehydrogenase family)